MQDKRINIKSVFFFFAFLLITFVYLYSDGIVKHEKLSFTGIMYTFSPWDSLEVRTEGPVLSDPADSDLPSVYDTFYGDDFFSLWNKDVALGTASEMFQKLYPLNLVYLLPVDAAVWVKTFLEFAIAIAGMAYLLWLFGVNKQIAFLFGIVYAFSGTMVMWLGWPHSDVAAFAPLVLALTHRLIKKKNLFTALFLAAAMYLMIIAGMPTYAAYFMYLAGVFVVVYAIIEYKNLKNIFQVYLLFGLAAILAIAMSIPYTVELLSSVGANGYAESRAEYAKAALGLEYLRTWIYPYFNQGFTLHQNESVAYAGILSVMLLPACLVHVRRKKKSIFFMVTAVICFLFSYTHILDAVYQYIPAINTSLKTRLITVLMFSVIVLAGMSLNDIWEHRLDYQKKWRLYIPVLIVYCGLIFVYFSKEIIFCLGQNDNLWNFIKTVIFMGAFGLLLLLLVFTEKAGKRSVLICILGLFVIWDCGGFAKDYFVWIDSDAEVIPQATDSIEYLQENTENYERFVALGGWTLFPNTNEYYGLYDIRSHNFVMTNEDMTAYYSAIRDGETQEYNTATRAVFTDIANYDLVRYLGVRYVVSDSEYKLVSVGSQAEKMTTVGKVNTSRVVEQQITVENDPIQMLRVLTATYSRELSENLQLVCELLDQDGEKCLEKVVVSGQEIRDNDYTEFKFENIYLPGVYTVRLYVSGDTDEKLTFWRNSTSEDGFALYVNGKNKKGCLLMQFGIASSDQDVVFKGQDGLFVRELDAYSGKVEVAQDIVLCDSSEEVLESMSQSYRKNTMFITGEVQQDAATGPLEEGEGAEILSYEDDEITIRYTLKDDRYLILNDYYDSNWHGYINGEPTEVIRGNYLLRGIYVTAGEDVVLTLKYESRSARILLTIAGVSALILAGLLGSCIVLGRKKGRAKA